VLLECGSASYRFALQASLLAVDADGGIKLRKPEASFRRRKAGASSRTPKWVTRLTRVATVGAFPTVGFCGLQGPTVRRALTVATTATIEVPMRILPYSLCPFEAVVGSARSAFGVR
jgi:hypothetical protein